MVSPMQRGGRPPARPAEARRHPGWPRAWSRGATDGASHDFEAAPGQVPG